MFGGSPVSVCYNRCMDLTLENLGRKGYKMYQPKEGFRFGTDTVLLSWFTASFVKDQGCPAMLELGAGSGAATLLTAARRENVHIDALEIDSDSYEVLEKNISINGLEGRVSAYRGDVRSLPDEIRNKQYDLVFMNPPFFKPDTGPSSGKIGRYEQFGDLNDFIKAGSSRLIPSSGIMTVVMKASRADEVMNLMTLHGVKPFRFMPVHPFPDKKAQTVLIAGKKTGAGTNFEIMAPLMLNDEAVMHRIYEEEHKDCFI